MSFTRQGEIDRARAEVEALKGALAVTHRVISPYVPQAKSAAPSTRNIGLNALRFVNADIVKKGKR